MPRFGTGSGGYERIGRSMDFIDEQGFRANVGIILTDGDGRVLIAGRRGRGGWQFPQGGIQPEETTEAAMFRELHEEVGLAPSDVELVGLDGRLAALSVAGSLHSPRADAALHRPEATLVPVAAHGGPKPRALRSDARARVRSLPLGRLLAARQRGRLFQAPRLRAGAARARPAGVSRTTGRRRRRLGGRAVGNAR